MLPCCHHPSYGPLPPIYPPSPISFSPPKLSCIMFAGVASDDVAGGKVVRRWVGEHSASSKSLSLPWFSQGAQRWQWWPCSSSGGVRKEHSCWSAGDLMSEFETTWHNFDVKTVRILRHYVWKKGQFTHFSMDFDKKNCRICRDCSTW
jgi:hypothetical protein